MPDLIFAVAFIAMVAAPAMVATLGGRKEYNPDPDPRSDSDSDTEPDTFTTVRPPKRPASALIRPFSAQKATHHDYGYIPSDEATLPIHNGRGMANR